MKSLLSIAALTFAIGSTAEANEKWNCNMQFEAKGGGIQLVIGHYEMQGTGTLNCTSSENEQRAIPVQVKMGGKFFQPKIAFGYMKTKGTAQILGLDAAPETVLGKYHVLNAEAAVLAGLGANVGLELKNDHDFKLQLGLQVVKGLGLAVGVETIQISAAQ